MLIIEPGTPVWGALLSALTTQDTYKVRIQVMPTTTGHKVAIKRNEGMWSPPMEIGFEPHDVYDKPTVLRFPGMPPIEGTGPIVEEVRRYLLQTWNPGFGAWRTFETTRLSLSEARSWQQGDPDKRRVLLEETREVVFQPVD